MWPYKQMIRIANTFCCPVYRGFFPILFSMYSGKVFSIWGVVSLKQGKYASDTTDSASATCHAKIGKKPLFEK